MLVNNLCRVSGFGVIGLGVVKALGSKGSGNKGFGIFGGFKVRELGSWGFRGSELSDHIASGLEAQTSSMTR